MSAFFDSKDLLENNSDGESLYDVIIIGGGCAGLSAYIYAKSAGYKALIIDKYPVLGGQINTSYKIDNYLGFKSIGGDELAKKFAEHAKSFGNDFYFDEVLSVLKKDEIFYVKCAQKTFNTKALIIAAGAAHKKLNVKGETEFTGKGVSYCAVCDGGFFKGKRTVVIGGGNSAVENALYLSKICSDVTIVHRRERLSANFALTKKLESRKNISVIYNAKVESINGDKTVKSITCKNKNGETEIILTDGVFISIGSVPQSGLFKELVETDERGYIITDEQCRTSTNGVFAAGDIRAKKTRQIITAASDGAIAASSLFLPTVTTTV